MLKSLHRGITATHNSRILNLSIPGGLLSRGGAAGWRHLAGSRDGFPGNKYEGREVTLPREIKIILSAQLTLHPPSTLPSPPLPSAPSAPSLSVSFPGIRESEFSLVARFPIPRKFHSHSSPSPPNHSLSPRETSFYPLISGPAPTFN